MLAALIEIRDRTAETASAFAAQQRSRRLDRLAEVSALVAKVRDVAISEETAGNSIGRPFSVGPPSIFPQTRMQLDIAVKSYEAETTRRLPESLKLATESTMNSLMAVVGAATSAFMELQREADDLSS
jgi:hypothetical protein